MGALVVVLATVATVALCVVVHYEGLAHTSKRIPSGKRNMRLKVLYGIASVIVLHAIEIGFFGAVTWVLVLWPECGSVQGATHFLDHFYLSAMNYTTVGVPDLLAVGPLRFLAATEALTGLVLIAWSASFTFLEMEQYWRGR
jgi:ion channel